MSETKIIFTFNGTDLTILCTPEDKIRDICQKLSIKIETNINSLIFLYGGKSMNMDLRFKEHANSLDRSNNVMRVLAYIKEVDDYICPHCGEKIKIKTEKIDEIISSNNKIQDTIDGIKFNIDNVIKISSVNMVNIQLKNINALLNTINENNKKNNEKLKNLINEHKNKNEFLNKNIIKGILDINEINNKIVLFNTKITSGIDVYLNNNKINMIQNGELWKIDYNFNKNGKYTFQIIFNNIITDMKGFFEKCVNIISLDFENFNTENVTDMGFMFNKCNKLKEIKGINKFNTNKVTNMRRMFQLCNELEYLDLSSFNTENVTNMSGMFNLCSKLKEIKGINQFLLIK